VERRGAKTVCLTVIRFIKTKLILKFCWWEGIQTRIIFLGTTVTVAVVSYLKYKTGNILQGSILSSAIPKRRF
jgi:hypothetical protein